jgi:uncharacterized OB-fold protein
MPNRPQPSFPELITQPFWDAAKEGKLTYQTCDDCDAIVFTPRRHCTACGSAVLTVQESKGEGTVYTYSVVRQNRMLAFAELGAYSVAYIDLDEGFRMMSTVTGVDDPVADISIGMRVKVEFEQQDDGEYPIPVFKPA